MVSEQPSISPVLFLMVDGEPMSFFLRPGPVKRKLQPLITAGGGMVCNVQQPGAILLIHPDERNTIPESAANWYVSTQYIYDCIEKEEQLNLEDYKLNPEVPQKHSTRYNSSKDRSPAVTGGRTAYTPEEDAAILSYARKHKTETGGNRLWQEMENKQVTCHSWQSMKYRYKVRLAKLQLDTEELETKDEDNKAAEDKIQVEENHTTEKLSHVEGGALQTNSTETDPTQLEGEKEAEVQKPSCEDDVLPQTHSADMDATQIEVEPKPVGSTPENEDPQDKDQDKEQHVNQQTDQPAESMQPETVEAETSDSPQAEAGMDSLTDAQLISAEATEPTACEPQTADPQQKQGSIPHTPGTSSSKKLKEKKKPSPQLEQPQQRVTRRKLELSSSPEPYGKRLRSSSTQPEVCTPSPRTLRKVKTPLKPALQKDTTTDHPPSKRSRRNTGTPAVAEESQEELSGPDTASETPQADETNSALQKADKKKEKRQLGILELATKEFEDGSESDEDEAADVQTPPEKEAPSNELLPPHSDTLADPASPQSDLEPGPSSLENVPKTGCPDAAAPEPAAPEPAVSEAVSAPSKAHLFIFESQEDDSQSVFGDRPTAATDTQPTVNKDVAFSLTQVQLEEDKQRITELMNQTDQDLVTVTKALLKTSGDFSAALNLLLNPSSVSGPFWNRHDDSRVLSTDPAVRRELQEKYGEEGVARRIMFLEVEG